MHLIHGSYQFVEYFNFAAMDYEKVVSIAPQSEYVFSLLEDLVFEIMEGYVRI